MTKARFRNRIAAWLALAGMALNAFWPLLANAKPNVPALPSEICSATGLKHGESAPAEAPGKSAQPSHCTLCPGSAERGVAISRAPGALSRPAHARTLAPAFFVELPLKAWFDPAAPPRAPPSSS